MQQVSLDRSNLAQTGANESARPAQSGAAGANQSARANPDIVTLNFVNADIDGVVKVVSEITGKNFVLDPRVKGTINIVSAKSMPRAFVYEVFLSALRLQGFAAVEDRGIVKIVPEADAELHPSPTLGPWDEARTGGDRIETRVFTLEYESAAQKVPGLGDLPVLGGLFRYKTRSHSKTNLMIFLRPTLVRDSRRADVFTGERYDYILGEQEKTKPAHDAVLPEMKSPTLPPRTVPPTQPAPPLEIEVRPYSDEGRN